MLQRYRSSSLQFLFALVVLVAAVVLLYRLGEPALKNWDEAIYAQVAKEIVQSGDWLTLHWQHGDWFEKPPLMFWIMAGFFRAFGVNEFWARAVSALAGAGTVAVVYSIGRLQRGPVCGLIAALVLLTTFQFVQMSRLVDTDILLIFFLYLAIFGYLRVRNGDRRWWYLASVSCALAFMVKSFASLFAPAAIGIALIIDRQLNETLKAKHFWLSVLAGLAVIIPWHAAMIYFHGSAFLNDYFYYHVWSRTTTALEGHGASYWFYFNEIWFKTHPWWIISPFAVLFSVWQIKRGGFSAAILALMLLVLVFFSLALTKSHAYIVPVYPALALLIADLLTWFWDRRQLVIRVAVVLVCVSFAYEAIGKIVPYYVRIESVDEGVKDLGRVAASQSSPPVLIVYSQNGEFDPQTALFYSNKRVVQTTLNTTYRTHTPYHDNRPIAEVVGAEPAGIILSKSELEPLRADYLINPVSESHDLVYATIRKQN